MQLQEHALCAGRGDRERFQNPQVRLQHAGCPAEDAGSGEVAHELAQQAVPAAQGRP